MFTILPSAKNSEPFISGASHQYHSFRNIAPDAEKSIKEREHYFPNAASVIETISSRGIAVPSARVRVLSGTEMCRTRPVTVTYAPPAFRLSGTKYSTVTSGRSGRRAFHASSIVSMRKLTGRNPSLQEIIADFGFFIQPS